MAILAELGTKFPCTTQGVEIPVDDEQVDIYAGEVMEAWFEPDRDISIEAAFQTLHEVLRMKEEYPHFVLHYIKIETRKISVQYSIAPMKTTGSPGLLVIAAILLAIFFAGLIITIGLRIRWTRGYLWSPTGNAVINAVHTETKKGISGVKIYVDGKEIGTTDGGSISTKGLLVGEHEFNGEPLEGFHDPAPITALINLQQVTNVNIWYRPSDIPEPKTGYLHVYTSPVIGVVYVDGEEKGPAPISIELSIGDHSVGFGPVEGYITPSPQTATIVGGQTTVKIGVYTSPEEGAWYEQLIKYALIGGGIILGAALVVPEVIRAISRRGEKKE